ncbi:MAG: hypothetical protein AAGA03_03280 [Planctomycetota bacterium]
MSDEALTPEELVLRMDADELLELLEELGFSPTTESAHAIQTLVAEMGSLEAAIVALTDDQVSRRAA